MKQKDDTSLKPKDLELNCPAGYLLQEGLIHWPQLYKETVLFSQEGTGSGLGVPLLYLPGPLVTGMLLPFIQSQCQPRVGAQPRLPILASP